MPELARQAKVAGAVASAALWHVGLGAARPHDLADLIAGLLVQSRRRVRDTAVVSNLAPQAAFRERHDDPVPVTSSPTYVVRSPKTRPLCMRLGIGQSGATLATSIL